MKIDSTITLTVVLALVATISPILTTLINNIHDSKIKRMDLEREHWRNTVEHRRNIFENYLRYAGRCIAVSDLETSKQYNEYYFLSILYVSDELRIEMEKVHKYMEDGEWEKATSKFQELIPKIHDSMQEI